MRLAAAGHERAFAVVYERHYRALYRYCRSILRNDADAQDALQSTFTAAFAALRRGGPNAPIRPWLFRIAHNEAVSALRRRRPTVELSDATHFQTTSVEDQVADRSRLDLLLHDLRELHDRQRSALVMRELSGLSHEEIALALETSVGAAKQAIYEARRSLFEFAEGRAMSCDEIRRTISDADGRLLRSRRVRAHLRECTACATFAAAITTRQRELRALVPALPAAAATGLLWRVAGVGSTHGTGSGMAGLAVGGASKTAGAALAANALAGVAVVASATVGVTLGVDGLTHGNPHAGAGRHGTPAARSLAAPHRTPAFAVSPAGRAANRGAHPATRLTKAS
ncbi:MAG TPA: RNA polymerase sigma factor, partial [Solirubrobacteraceae bacterium]|nr:RNA polymerase sigma factor [Solirubrobacteraceae bacterium]